MDAAEELLIEYFHSLQKKSVKYTAKIKKDFNGKDIHSFRVCIKKMHAFTEYLNFLSNDFSSDNKITKNFYKAAGRIRDLYLIKKELKRLNLYDIKWKLFLKEKLTKDKEDYKIVFKKFRENFKNDVRLGKNRVFFTLKRTANLEAASKKYVKHQRQEIYKFSKAVLNDASEIHLLRKNFKKFYYNYFAVSEAFYLPLDNMLQVSIENLNEILGRWHDKVVFKKFVSKHSAIKSAQRIMEQTNREIELFHQTILNQLKIFIVRELKI